MIKLGENVIDTASDMWMLGCISYILVFGEHPFAGRSKSFILENRLKYEKEGWMTDLTRKLLSKNPKERPTSHETVELLNLRIKRM